MRRLIAAVMILACGVMVFNAGGYLHPNVKTTFYEGLVVGAESIYQEVVAGDASLAETGAEELWQARDSIIAAVLYRYCPH